MDSTSTTITFIGGGNMARSIISGLIKNKLPSENIQVIEPDSVRAADLIKDFSIRTHPEASAEILNVDLVLFAVKPQIFKPVCKELENHWGGSSAIILSIAAGIKIQSIRNWTGNNHITAIKIVRTMPNTPALIGLGATGLYSDDELTDNEISSIENIFNAVGSSVWLNSEDDLETVTALSGSGPAYFFSLCEHLIAAGIEQGLDPAQAHELVVQTAIGSAHMAKSAQINKISTLRANVTSKGGTTEAGLNELANQNFELIIKKVIQAAKNRSKELSKDFI